MCDRLMPSAHPRMRKWDVIGLGKDPRYVGGTKSDQGEGVSCGGCFFEATKRSRIAIAVCGPFS